MINHSHDLADQTVLITGANGFLGRLLAAELARNGVATHAISRKVPGPGSGVQWWQGDLTDYGWLQGLMDRIHPDVVYHLASAGQGGQDLDLVLPTFDNDLRTTVNTLVAAKRCSCKRVITVASLEEPSQNGLSAVPTSPYAAAKTASGLYARMFHQLYDLPVTMLRVFMSYGPGQKAHKVVPYTVLSLLNGKSPVLGSGVRLLDWVYVEDVIPAFITAAVKPEAAGLTIELGSGTLVSLREVVEQIHSLIPQAPPLHIGASPDRLLENIRPAADTQTAQKILNWKATTSLGEGLTRTIDWYRSQYR